MGKISYVEVTKEDSLLDQIEQLFSDCYSYMSQKGLLMPLIDNGEKLWRSSVEKTIGKFKLLVAAKENDRVLAFALGSLLFSPDYLGSDKIGVVNYIYVIPEFRGQEIGSELYGRLEEWFKEKKTHSIELQTLVPNKGAIKFWEKSGYKRELIQMRKIF